jgi:hypothetical protein
VKKSFERDAKPVPTPSPTTFLADFEAQFDLFKLADESDKMKWLPECMGPSVKWFAARIRAQSSWHTMTQLFE